MKRINYEVKAKMVELSGACFWYWGNLYSFLDSSGVPKDLQQKYPKAAYNKYEFMRNIITSLEEKGDIEILNNIISNFYKLRNAVDKDNVDEIKAQTLLNEFRELVGNDPIERKIREQEQNQKRKNTEEAIQKNQLYSKNLQALNDEFITLTTSKDISPQQRGFSLEKIFFDLLRIDEFDYTPPYKTTGEQIDGHFKYENFDYLVEIKWTKEVTKQKDLSIFDGKITGKAQSTRGFFLSASGFDENAINRFSGDSPRIVLMDGKDLALLLNGTYSLFDVMRAKIDAFVRHGNINFPAYQI